MRHRSDIARVESTIVQTVQYSWIPLYWNVQGRISTSNRYKCSMKNCEYIVSFQTNFFSRNSAFMYNRIKVWSLEIRHSGSELHTIHRYATVYITSDISSVTSDFLDGGQRRNAENLRGFRFGHWRLKSTSVIFGRRETLEIERIQFGLDDGSKFGKGLGDESSGQSDGR